VQLKWRFGEDTLRFLKEMQLFTPTSLNGTKEFSCNDIHELYTYYGIDSITVCKELKEFTMTYRPVEKMVSLDDITNDSFSANDTDTDTQDTNTQVTDKNPTIDDDEASDVDNSLKIKRKWTEHGFIKPLRVIIELFGFPSLTYLYKIFNSLPVTSCSAERAMSRVRIIKNRLRCTMSDDWFSSLMVLSAEKDLLNNLSMDDIIGRFSLSLGALQKQLRYQ